VRYFAVREAAPGDEATQGTAGQKGARGVLGTLFPEPAAPAPRAPGRHVLSAAAQVVAVGLGVLLLLERVPGLPSWDGIYAEDYWMFLPQTLQHPWHLFVTFGGYEQLLPRVIAQITTYFPLAQASRVFAVCGALVAALCGLFVFHASEGHVRSPLLRAVLGAAVPLMPIALMEIVDSGVGAPWFLLPGTFWALLWRPRTRGGMAAAALLAFTAAASEVMTALFLPLVAVRLFVLRRPREHAVTAGWLAGCLVQVPMVVSGYLSGKSRLNRQPGSLGHSLAFYAHDILLPSFGWHLAWRLESFASRNVATVITAVLLALIVGAIFVTQRGNRPFVVTAVLTGFLFPVFSTILTPNVASYPVVLPDLESGSRYTVLPIFLFESVAVVGVDYLMRQRDGRRLWRGGPGLLAAVAAAALVVVLAASWVADFRYATFRSEKNWNWAPIAATWLHDCELSRTGSVAEKTAILDWTLPCDHVR
jgi:hypothetical protein